MHYIEYRRPEADHVSYKPSSKGQRLNNTRYAYNRSGYVVVAAAVAKYLTRNPTASLPYCLRTFEGLSKHCVKHQVKEHLPFIFEDHQVKSALTLLLFRPQRHRLHTVSGARSETVSNITMQLSPLSPPYRTRDPLQCREFWVVLVS